MPRRGRPSPHRILGLYFLILISIQAIGIAYFLQDPKLHKGIFLAILLGTILPITLGLIFTKIFG